MWQWPGCARLRCSAPAPPRRKCRSTARARRSRTRSTRSGSASTTSCTRTCRSTTSRSARAAASGRSPNQTVFFGATDGPMTDEQLQGRAGQDPALPDGARRASCRSTTSRASRRAQVHRAAARRHLPRQDHEVERPGDREAEPGRRSCPATRHHRRAPLRRLAARPTSWSTTWPRSRRSGRRRSASRTSVNWPVGLGGKGNEGVAGLVKQTPGAHRLRRADLRAAEQDRVRRGAERGRRVREGQRSSRSPPRPPAPRRRCRRTSASRSRTRPGKGVYPISSFTWLLLYENPKDKAQAKAMVDFMKWALTDGQKFAPDLGYAPLPGSGREAGDGSAGRRSRLQ